jgi:hypothetical protein
VQAAIMAAFDEVGGKDYLRTVAKSHPRTFCTGQDLAMQVAGDTESSPDRIEFAWLPPQSSGL